MKQLSKEVNNMEHAGTFLLKKIVNAEKEGLPSLGQFSAKHFNDIVKVMSEFAELTTLNVIERLNNGEKIKIQSKVLTPKP